MLTFDVPKLHVKPDEFTESLIGYADHVKRHGGERLLKLLKKKPSGYLAFNLIRPIHAASWITDPLAELPSGNMSTIETIDDVVEKIHVLSGIIEGMYEPGIRRLVDEVFGGSFKAILDNRPDGDVIWVGSSELILLIHG